MDFFDKLAKLKWFVKVGITVGLMLVIGAIYYFIFYGELEDKIKSANQHRDQLRTEKSSYEKRKAEYLAYRNELNVLQEQQRELLKALPKKAEMPSFIANIQEQAELAGLEVLKLDIDPEVPQELYIKIPVRMEVRGTYHQITRFFRNLSELRRIVNAENLSLQPERAGNAMDLQGSIPTRIRARFIAATFRFIDTPGGK